MGEEVASDINQIEQSLMKHSDIFNKLQMQMETCQQDMKIAQLCQ
jgi:hypothetical protein